MRGLRQVGRMAGSVAMAAGIMLLTQGARAQARKPEEANQKLVAKFRLAPSEGPQLSADQIAALLPQKVKYVFVFYQENRSFDSYFGTYPGADGLFSQPEKETPGFQQPIENTDGSMGEIEPFRIEPGKTPCGMMSECYAADTDDVNHSHEAIVKKMDIVDGAPWMDRFALSEEERYVKGGNPSLLAKQMGELTMAYEDCDTVPLLWRYASRFVLFDRIFQEMAGPSTLGNISIIAAQTGQTQWMLHPNEAERDGKPGVPVMNDDDPFWGSPYDTTPDAEKMPFNPEDFERDKKRPVQLNLTFASLPLTLMGGELGTATKSDRDPKRDLADIGEDIPYITGEGQKRVAFGWYQEGFGSGAADPDDGPEDANGLHAAYITHHNGPQYFGYISNNPKMSAQMHGLPAFFEAVEQKKLPEEGGVFFVKGGCSYRKNGNQCRNILGLTPADPDPEVNESFRGDDDHPAYSDAQISEAMVAEAINKIAASPYWPESVIIITWDDSEGDYDHVRPPIVAWGPDGLPISDGPRVPFLLISPYARAGYVAHEQGNQASVVKFADTVFNLTPLALLPDEERGRKIGEQLFGQANLGPEDALTPDVTDLLEAFSPERLEGKAEPLPASYAEIPEELIRKLPEETHYGCRSLGIVTTDRAQGIANPIPKDFNPRPKTQPSGANLKTQ